MRLFDHGLAPPSPRRSGGRGLGELPAMLTPPRISRALRADPKQFPGLGNLNGTLAIELAEKIDRPVIRVEVGHTVVVKQNGCDLDLGIAGVRKAKAQHNGLAPHPWPVTDGVDPEIAETVRDWLPLVELDAMQLMRMVPNHRVRTGVDQGVSKE